MAAPVGRMIVPVPTLPATAGIGHAAQVLAESSVMALPVIDDERFVGLFGHAQLSQVLGEGRDLYSPVASLALNPYSVGREESAGTALRLILDQNVDAVAVLDPSGYPLGIVTRLEFFASGHEPLRPAMVGGMATPLGVYLTTGAVSAGPPRWALALTGAVMFSMLFIGNIAGDFLGGFLFGLRWPIPIINAVSTGVVFVVFLSLLRLSPLAGYHGAEHQVVHAIERGEPLVPVIVARMPRVHPRCGTNLAAAVVVFLSLATAPWPREPELRLLLALVATAAIWRPLGSLLQAYVTTRKPNAEQLRAGIRSGEELLRRHADQGVARPSVLTRIWNSGILLVLAGSMGMAALVVALARFFGWEIAL
jgi:CBS domain-containing protein